MKIASTLYAQYIKEREGSEVLESEDGFIVYKISKKECFIVDMFVAKDRRARGAGHALLKSLDALAAKRDCEFITANIHLWDAGASNTLLAALTAGFLLGSANAGHITIFREVGGHHG